MPKFKEYLKDENGKPSSARLFSAYFMWFFFVSNIMILSGVLYGNVAVDLNLMLMFMIYDFFLLLAIFAPKQLGKIEEIRKIIELAKIQQPKILSPTEKETEKE